MGLKANLRIKLYADDNFVAEIDGAPLMLWQQLLAHSEGTPPPATATANTHVAHTALPKTQEAGVPEPYSATEYVVEQPPQSLQQASDLAIQKLASDIEVSVDAVVSAFDPSDTAPYISLEHKYWEAFRGNAPKRGPLAVSPIAIAATLLALWKMHSKKDFSINAALIAAVLKGIDVEAQNVKRSLNNSDWLKLRQDGEVVLIPDNMKKARAAARAFCIKQPIQNTNA